MKRIVSYTLLVLLYSTVFAWAYNNVLDERDKPKKEKGFWAFGRRRSTDKDGPLTTDAWTQVDVDFKGEAVYIRKYGIEYEGHAQVQTSRTWGSGYYSISASADNRYPLYGGNGWLFYASDSISDPHFVPYTGSSVPDLKRFTEDEIRDMLENSNCSGLASIDRYSDSGSGSGSGSGYAENRSVAEAD